MEKSLNTGDLFTTEWTEENKWNKFKQGMEEAMSLLQFGKTKADKQSDDFMDMFKGNMGGSNPFGI